MATTTIAAFEVMPDASRASWWFNASGSDIADLASQISALAPESNGNPSQRQLILYSWLAKAADDAQVTLQNSINTAAASAASAAAQATYLATKTGSKLR